MIQDLFGSAVEGSRPEMFFSEPCEPFDHFPPFRGVAGESPAIVDER